MITAGKGGGTVELKWFLRKSIQKNKDEVKRLVAQERQKKIDEMSRDSGLPKRFRYKSFENFRTSDNPGAYKKAHEFAEKFPNVRKGLLLTGPVGTGKTHLAAAITKALIDKLYAVYFGNVTDIMARIKGTYAKDAEMDEDEVIRVMTEKVDLLVIDDLGKEDETPNTMRVLYQIINKLYENEKAVVITTNFGSSILARKLGERGAAIVSRITGMCEPVSLSGKDWRLVE